MRLWILVVLVAVATSCGVRSHRHSHSQQTTVSGTSSPRWPEAEKITFEYLVRDGHATLESDRVVLIFHELTATQQNLFRFQGGRQAVQVAGVGSSTVSVNTSTERGSVSFRSEYANGTNTLTFASQTVRFAERGRLLLAGDQTIDLGKGRQIVHLHAGKVRVE